MDQIERQALELAAPHEVIVARQAQTVLGAAADDGVLGRLAGSGLLRRVRLAKGVDAGYSIRAGGLAALGSELPAPPVRFAGWHHALGVSWLWVAIRKGVYGPARCWTRRELVAGDVARAKAGGTQRPAGVRVGGISTDNATGLHHPDLLSVTDEGHWVAFYLQLGFPSRRQLAAMLTAYGVDERFDAVLFLVEDQRVGRVVNEEAAALGLSELVRVQHFAWRH